MDISYISEIIKENYDIEIRGIEKIKNSYKIEAEDGGYGIKVIGYQFPHFYFILSAIKHLQRGGFIAIPEILKTKNNMDYIKLGDKYAYVTEWISSRVSNYDNPVELSMISKKLGELHSYSNGFRLNYNMLPRYGWYTWINTFNTRCEEILDFRKRIYQKAKKSDFDKIFLENVDREVRRGQESIDGLIKNNYFEVMNKEVMKCGFCHHDFAHHNVLIDERGGINIIDFDYCILDSHLHDLSSLLIRSMKNGKWNYDTADLILNSYSITNTVRDDELNIMKYFIRFPQSFWQIGLQYYWEQQPWGEEFFINKINRYLEDIEYREEFLEGYFK